MPGKSGPQQSFARRQLEERKRRADAQLCGLHAIDTAHERRQQIIERCFAQMSQGPGLQIRRGVDRGVGRGVGTGSCEGGASKGADCFAKRERKAAQSAFADDVLGAGFLVRLD